MTTKKEEEAPLSAKELDALLAVGAGIADSIGALEESGVSSRELSLVLTKLEEGEMWLNRAFEEMGYEPAPEDEDEDEDEEEEGESGDEEE